MLALALVGGLFVGFIVWMVKQVFELLFILPLGIGLICGLCLMWTIYCIQMPSRRVAIAAGIIVATCTYGTVHYLSYQYFLNEAASALRENGFAGTFEEINTLLASRTGLTGFWGVLSYRAQQGFAMRPLYSDIATPVNALGT